FPDSQQLSRPEQILEVEPPSFPILVGLPEPPPDDDAILKSVDLGPDAPSLLKYLRERTLSEKDRGALSGLVPKLGSEDFTTREKAYTDLLAIGSRVVPLLVEAMKKETDLEIKARADSLFRRIEHNQGVKVPAAAARKLAKLKHADATSVLLAYLPF